MKLMLVLGILVTLCSGVLKTNGLSNDYYNEMDHFCPPAKVLIKDVVRTAVANNPGVAAKLLRLHFHDCFVRGCDASVLIFKGDGSAERDGLPNANSLGGYEVIDQAKAIVEQHCPRTVSCADIVALAARDAVVELGGPYGPLISWDVPLGRKDGNESFASETNQLPSPFSDVATLISKFTAKGLNTQQMVVLSGAHTIGTANCTSVNNRLYNFTGVGDTDPSLDANYATYLKSECSPNIQTVRIAMKDFLDNHLSNNAIFDNQYYVNLEQHKGLFSSDNALITNGDTKSFVDLYAGDSMRFIADFKDAMIAMGNIDVLTTGYVRQTCSVAFS